MSELVGPQSERFCAEIGSSGRGFVAFARAGSCKRMIVLGSEERKSLNLSSEVDSVKSLGEV